MIAFEFPRHDRFGVAHTAALGIFDVKPDRATRMSRAIERNLHGQRPQPYFERLARDIMHGYAQIGSPGVRRGIGNAGVDLRIAHVPQLGGPLADEHRNPAEFMKRRARFGMAPGIGAQMASINREKRTGRRCRATG